MQMHTLGMEVSKFQAPKDNEVCLSTSLPVDSLYIYICTHIMYKAILYIYISIQISVSVGSPQHLPTTERATLCLHILVNASMSSLYVMSRARNKCLWNLWGLILWRRTNCSPENSRRRGTRLGESPSASLCLRAVDAQRPVYFICISLSLSLSYVVCYTMKKSVRTYIYRYNKIHIYIHIIYIYMACVINSICRPINNHSD